MPAVSLYPDLAPAASCVVPCLEYLAHSSNNVQRLLMETLPFTIGRTNAAHFAIPSGHISRVHAEIDQTSDGFRLRDLNSTNGTYLNGRRIQNAELNHGDIFCLAHHEFRFLLEEDEADEAVEQTDPSLAGSALPPSVLFNLPLLKDLIHNRRVRTFFQPIATLDGGAVVGYEALGRGTHGKLSARPVDLFSLAERCQLAGRLSQAFRAAAVAEVGGLPGLPALWLNTHPAELGDPQLLESLRQLRDTLPDQAVVLEIHEQTVTSLRSLRLLREQLRDLNIGLAYDDFGTGQSRLAELTEVPPDFVKLDMVLIRNLHQSPPRQGLVRAITQVAQDLGVQVLAEGIETEEEADICRRLGCTLGQGFLLGYPEAAPLTPVEDTWKVGV